MLSSTRGACCQRRSFFTACLQRLRAQNCPRADLLLEHESRNKYLLCLVARNILLQHAIDSCLLHDLQLGDGSCLACVENQDQNSCLDIRAALDSRAPFCAAGQSSIFHRWNSCLLDILKLDLDKAVHRCSRLLYLCSLDVGKGLVVTLRQSRMHCFHPKAQDWI